MHTGAGFSVIQRKAVSVVIIGQRHLIRAFALCRCFGVSLGSIRTTVLRYALRHDHKTAVVAIAVLELLISKVFLKTLELADKVISKELEARPENTDFKEQKAVPEESRKQTDTPKPAIPPRPQPSPEAVSYKHLCEIYQKLQEQNKAIFALEKQRSDLEIELSDSKGIFKAKRRSELSTEIAGLEERISRMKARLSHIVKEYGYQNAEAFYKAFHKSETAYGDYQASLKNWKQRYGEKPQSLHDRLISKKQDIKERELTRPYSPPNRGRSR